MVMTAQQWQKDNKDSQVLAWCILSRNADAKSMDILCDTVMKTLVFTQLLTNNTYYV